jgi:hypothetical protein
MMTIFHSLFIPQKIVRKRTFEEEAPRKRIEVYSTLISDEQDNRLWCNNVKCQSMIKKMADDPLPFANDKDHSLELEGNWIWCLDTRFSKPTQDSSKTGRGHKREARVDFKTMSPDILASICNPNER